MRKRYEEEDEEETPRKRRRVAEEDEDEAPKKKKHLPATPGAVNLLDMFDGKFTSEDMEAQAKEDVAFGGAGGGKRYLKLSADSILRLCPKRKGSRIMYRELSRHGVKDAGEGKWKPVVCVAKMTPPGRCYICEVLAEVKRSLSPKDTDGLKEIEEQGPRAGAYWNAIDMREKEAGAGEIWLPISVHKEIKVQTGLADRDIRFEPWDIEEGFPLHIRRDKQNKYSVKLLHKKAEQLDQECYLGAADLEKSLPPLPPKELFAIAKYMAETYDVLEQMDWDDVPWLSEAKSKKKRQDDEDEDEAPVKKAKKKRPVDDDEDERPKKRRVLDDDDFEAATSFDDDDGRKVVVEVPTKKKKKREVVEDDWE